MSHTIKSLKFVPDTFVPYHPTFPNEERSIYQGFLSAKDMERKHVGYVTRVSLISFGITNETKENTMEACNLIRG
jgi:hypothetical protein